ncbi:hypothetical protein ACFE04_019536 [Oxalis oulophora]
MDSSSKSESLKYKVGSIAAILVAGALGVGLPLLGKRIPALRPENDKFFVVKAFAAGVILSTGFVHILPDAFENLNSPCLDPHPWGDFPFTGFIAMKSRNAELVNLVNESTTAITAVTVDAITVTVDTHGTGGHADGAFHAHGHHHHDGGEGSGVSNSSASEIIRQRIVSHVLEIGIVVHSVIIGISLGASQSADTIKPLMAALCFHQFFEGIGLGGCISQANFKSKSMAIMATFFSLTTPVGIAIGIGISSVYDENSSTALIVEGVFNSSSAGILIYMALVDLLAADFMNPRMQANIRIQLAANISLY